MNTKRFLSLFIALVLCLSSITVLVNGAEEIEIETIVEAKAVADNLSMELGIYNDVASVYAPYYVFNK